MSMNLNQVVDTITPSTGTLNVVGALTVNGSPVTTGGTASIVLGSDASSTSTTLSNVTGMSFTAVAGKTYVVDLYGWVRATNANSNPLFALDVVDGTVVGMNGFGGQGQPYGAWQDQTGDALLETPPTVGLRAVDTDFFLMGKWLHVAATGGTVQLQIRIRSVTGAGTGTLKAGSTLRYTQVN